MSNMAVSCRVQDCLPFAGDWVRPRIMVGSVLLNAFSFLYCVVWFVFVLYRLCPILPVSLDCTFVIAPFLSLTGISYNK